jgi:valyl-tRNA synthetase
LGEFNFGEAGRLIHDFLWDEVADWYLEAYKVLAWSGNANGALLAQVFEKTVRLLHPYAPFVTEELWQGLTTGLAERPVSVMVADWPEPADTSDPNAEAEWSDIMALTRAARTLRAEYRIEPSRAVAASILAPTQELTAFWQANADVIGALPGTRLAPIEVRHATDGVEAELAARSIAAVAGGVELLIPAAGLFDVRTELSRTTSELADAQKQVSRLETLLAGDFSRKAPAETVERERARLQEQRDRLETLQRRRTTLTRLASAE